jgi:hypothetical protein
MNHSTTRFRNALAYLSNGATVPLASQSPQAIQMTSDGSWFSRRLGTVDSFDATTSNFSEHWNACS